MKKIIEKLVIKFFSIKIFSFYTRKYKLSKETFLFLIKQNKIDFLKICIKNQEITSEEISMLLSECENMPEIVALVLKNNKLNSEQQMQLVKTKNHSLIEIYLSPNEFFDVNRRFDPEPEKRYIQNCLLQEDLSGVEVFKTYANTIKYKLAPPEILDIIANQDTLSETAKFFLRGIHMDNEEEKNLLEKCPVDILKEIFEIRKIYSGDLHIMIVEKSPELAKYYHDKFKLSETAAAVYFGKN